MGGMDRLEVIAAIVSIAGVVLCARGSYRLARSVRARFTYGAPYRSGTIQDRLLGLLLEIVVLLLGAVLGFLALGQADFQPNASTVRVGQIEAHRSGWAKVSVRLIPDPLYPSGRVMEQEIAGARWAVVGDFITWDRSLRWLGFRDGHRVRYLIGASEIGKHTSELQSHRDLHSFPTRRSSDLGARWAVVGDFITWDRSLRWLGFRDGHRVRYLIGASDTTGMTRADRIERALLDPLPRAAARLFSVARFIPFLEIRSESSSWFPVTDRQVMILYAIGPGYLAEVASESGK